mmetsp:Transcript_11672/g.27073  ORF Transcript_11672/g.27073 Transcript_11672/m.27073 type:complete len:168 (+) Transcript_11672:192-695(+)
MANLHSPGASGHARQPLIEGVANDALLLVLLCVSSVLLLVLFEYRRHTLSAPPPPPSDSEITILTRLNALWCYITGQPEAPIIQPGEGDARWSDAPTPTCPICIEEVVWAVETSCGHAFLRKMLLPDVAASEPKQAKDTVSHGQAHGVRPFPQRRASPAGPPHIGAQ